MRSIFSSVDDAAEHCGDRDGRVSHRSVAGLQRIYSVGDHTYGSDTDSLGDPKEATFTAEFSPRFDPRGDLAAGFR